MLHIILSTLAQNREIDSWIYIWVCMFMSLHISFALRTEKNSRRQKLVFLGLNRIAIPSRMMSTWLVCYPSSAEHRETEILLVQIPDNVDIPSQLAKRCIYVLLRWHIAQLWSDANECLSESLASLTITQSLGFCSGQTMSSAGFRVFSFIPEVIVTSLQITSFPSSFNKAHE